MEKRKGTPLTEVEQRFLDLPFTVQSYINTNARIQSMAGLIPAKDMQVLHADQKRLLATIEGNPVFQASFYEFVEFRDQQATEKSN